MAPSCFILYKKNMFMSVWKQYSHHHMLVERVVSHCKRSSCQQCSYNPWGPSAWNSLFVLQAALQLCTKHRPEKHSENFVQKKALSLEHTHMIWLAKTAGASHYLLLNLKCIFTQILSSCLDITFSGPWIMIWESNYYFNVHMKELSLQYKSQKIRCD